MKLEDVYRFEWEIKRILAQAILEADLNFDDAEPRIVSRLLSALMGAFNGNIAGLLSEAGLSVSAGGVFVHQQPQVKSFEFPQKKAVEIGDLLLIMNFERENGTIDRTALLYQVKKDDYPDRNENQQYLYKNWPRFEYFRSTPRLNGKERQVTGPHLYNGARYLHILFPDGKIHHWLRYHHAFCHFICRGRCRDCDECALLCRVPIVAVDPSRDFQHIHDCLPLFGSFFIDEMFRFLVGNSGRQFDYQPSGNNINWDQVITDLLDITAQNATSYYKDLPRGQGVFQMMGRFDGPSIIGKTIPREVIAGPSKDRRDDYKDKDVYGQNVPDIPEDMCGANILEINITPSKKQDGNNERI